MTFDELVGVYGPDAMLTLAMERGEDGQLVRWIVEIGGATVDDLDVRTETDGETTAIFLVGLGADREFMRWSPPGMAPPSMSRPLKSLIR